MKAVGCESHISTNAKQKNGQPFLFTTQICNPTPMTLHSPEKEENTSYKKINK